MQTKRHPATKIATLPLLLIQPKAALDPRLRSDSYKCPSRFLYGSREYGPSELGLKRAHVAVEVRMMLEATWTDQDERSSAEDPHDHAVDVLELELAIADDHRRRDQMNAERGHIRASLGLRRSGGR